MEKTDKRRKYNAAFHTEALRVVAESRSTPAAARALNLDPKLLDLFPNKKRLKFFAALGNETVFFA